MSKVQRLKSNDRSNSRDDGAARKRADQRSRRLRAGQSWTCRLVKVLLAANRAALIDVHAAIRRHELMSDDGSQPRMDDMAVAGVLFGPDQGGRCNQQQSSEGDAAHGKWFLISESGFSLPT